jgi:DMSO/TMAO reductase YedYZ molybdopterin-dependent catalytic subunit
MRSQEVTMNRILKWMQAVVSRRFFISALGLGLCHLLGRGMGWAQGAYQRVTELLIRSIEGTQKVNLKTWSLKVEGLIEKPISLRFEEIQRLPRKLVVKDFQCVEGWGLEKLKWEGVPLKEILGKVRINPKAAYVTFHATGGKYSDSLSIQEALEPDTLLAYKLNGKDLPPENGFPLRLVIPRMYAYKSVKWVERIVFTEKQEVGYWEANGYPVDASIPG